MDSMASIKVMLWIIEEVQILLLHDGNKDLSMKHPQMISQSLIKIKNTVLYSKAIDKLGLQEVKDCQTWPGFRTFMIGQYDKMLRSHEGFTVANQGYGAAFSATAGDDSTRSILPSITKYAEHATTVDTELRDIKGSLSTLQNQFTTLMTGQMHMTNFVPQQPPISTIQIGKKRKSLCEGNFQAPQVPVVPIPQLDHGEAEVTGTGLVLRTSVVELLVPLGAVDGGCQWIGTR